MDAPMLPQFARRGAAYRSACLAIGALCLLAVLAGAVGQSGTTVHHNHHALAAAAIGYDIQGASSRAATDAVAADRASARVSAARPATSAGAAPEPHRQAPDTLRTRGPPAAA